MSQGGAEQVRRMAEAVKRGDIEAVIGDLASDVEWTPAFPVLLGGEELVYRGHDGVREMFRGFYDVLDEIDVEYSEIRDLGDCIVALGRMRTRAGLSGIATESPFAFVADIRNGKLVRVRTYLDPEEGLEAAELGGVTVSEENVELVRRFTEGFNELGIDRVIELIAPDWVGHPFRGWIGDPVYRGREGMRELTAIWTDNFDDYRVEIRELTPVGDSVLALCEHGGTAKHADAPVGEPMAAIFGPFADGMIAGTSFFLSWEEGRQAAGLSE